MQHPLIRTFIIISLLLSTTVFARINIPFKAPGTLTVVAYNQFKPISYGNGQGYEADLLRAIAKLWQVNIRFYPESFYDGIWRIPSRSYSIADVSIGGMTPTESRKKEGAAFSMMTTHFSQSLLIRRKDFESGKITSYQSFKNGNMKIGVVPGTTGEQYAHLRAKEANVPLEVFEPCDGESTLLPALINGKVDAIARGEIGNDYQAMINHEFVTIEKRNFKEGFVFALDRNNPTMVKEINKAIDIVTDHGNITYVHWLKNHNVFAERVSHIMVMK